MAKARMEPLSTVEGNWHGDGEDGGGDFRSARDSFAPPDFRPRNKHKTNFLATSSALNFVEWLACILRMSLVGFGSLGHTPDECIEKCAEIMMLQGTGDEPYQLQRIPVCL